MGSTKKKVSFDMEPGLLSDVRSLCESRGITPADFYRDAVKEKLERDARHWITIYIPIMGDIEKVTVDMTWYELELFEASDMMRDDFDAVHQGILRKKSPTADEQTFTDWASGESSRAHNPVILEILGELGRVYFFTKNRYA